VFSFAGIILSPKHSLDPALYNLIFAGLLPRRGDNNSIYSIKLLSNKLLVITTFIIPIGTTRF
jgi:hypothetical protein